MHKNRKVIKRLNLQRHLVDPTNLPFFLPATDDNLGRYQIKMSVGKIGRGHKREIIKMK